MSSHSEIIYSDFIFASSNATITFISAGVPGLSIIQDSSANAIASLSNINQVTTLIWTGIKWKCINEHPIQSAGISILPVANNTATPIDITTGSLNDPSDNYDTTTSAPDIFARTNGFYTATIYTRWATPAASTLISVRILYNGVIIAQTNSQFDASPTIPPAITVSTTLINTDSTQAIRFQVLQISGGNLNLDEATVSLNRIST